jgi:uncharacterized protein YjbI with pentapeptide repeats
MANHEHLAKLKEGVEAWNKWRTENPGVYPDLEGTSVNPVDLRGAKLAGANLSDVDLTLAMLADSDLSAANLRNADLGIADLSGTNLSQGVLCNAYFGFADLTDATLESANLGDSNFSGATLVDANLTDADLRDANLKGADLSNSDFTDAKIGHTVFGDNNLSTTKGLDTVKHDGPSTIGTDTILRSRGNIPESFLRGCGVPDEFIAFAKSLVSSPIQFYSCFISYSTKDQTFADRLYADLQNKGVRCWFAPHDVQGGRKLHEQIDEAIRLHDKLLLILSSHSMESEWVKTEIAKARKRELRDNRRVLFPIRLAPFETLRDWECFDADNGKDSAREIREYFIPDFSNWKDHDSYQEAFRRLIADLKASDLRRSKP